MELADFARLVRLTSIKFVADHLRDFDHNRDKLVTEDELEKVFGERDRVESMVRGLGTWGTIIPECSDGAENLRQGGCGPERGSESR